MAIGSWRWRWQWQWQWQWQCRHGVAAVLGMWACCALAQERYQIDPQHTFSTFEYEHWGLSLQRGRFDGNSGSILFDPVGRRGEIVVSIATGSVSTGTPLFDAILRSPEFFDAAAHPVITFRSTALHFDSERLVSVDGNLSIKGTTRSVTLTMTRFNCRFMLMYGKRACGANGFARLSRSDFDLGRYVPFVSDAVTLYVSVEAIQDPVREPEAVSSH
jgi:polyisoprenoid-binding protein YceI